jgi:Calcineurin-like phosphoesterase
MSVAKFNVIHVSDLHCGVESDAANIFSAIDSWKSNQSAIQELPRSIIRGMFQTTYNLEIAKKAARFIVLHSGDASLIVASGDLATSGRSEDLRVAYNFFEGSPRSSEMFFVTSNATPTIARATLPVLLIPGNHDRFKDAWGAAGGTEFDDIFQSHWPDPVARVRRRVLEDPSTGLKLGLVGADLCLWKNDDARPPSAINRFGQGKAHKQVVSAMKTETQALRASYPGVGVAWVIHFPRCATDAENPLLELLDRVAVLDAARNENIRLILAGHIHVPALVQDGNISVSCAGSAAAYLCPHGYWIHKLEIEVTDSIASLTDRANFAWNGSDFALKI